MDCAAGRGGEIARMGCLENLNLGIGVQVGQGRPARVDADGLAAPWPSAQAEQNTYALDILGLIGVR